jgi:flagellar biosynthesis/type III secretory pathway chaperone
MTLLWQNIADCLRAELSEYGSLLQLFEQQQQLLFSRNADGVLRLSGEIEAQVNRLHDCRARREQAAMEFAVSHGHPPGATLRSMLPSVPADARPLVEALINEVNHLIHRTRRITRHNHALLARAVETHQEFLRIVRPDAFTHTYAANGRMSPALRAGPVLQTAG